MTRVWPRHLWLARPVVRRLTYAQTSSVPLEDMRLAGACCLVNACTTGPDSREGSRLYAVAFSLARADGFANGATGPSGLLCVSWRRRARALPAASCGT